MIVFFVCYACFGLSLWMQKSKEWQNTIEDASLISAFETCCAGIWVLLVVFSPRSGTTYYQQHLYQAGSLLIALFFSLRVVFYETKNLPLRFCNIFIIVFIVALLFSVPHKSFFSTLKLFTQINSLPIIQWAILFIFFFFTFILLLCQEMQNNWDFFTFVKKHNRPIQFSLRLLLLFQVYTTSFIAAISIEYIRHALLTVICLIPVIVFFFSLLLAMLYVYWAILPIEFFLLPGVWIIGIIGINPTTNCPYSFVALSILFYTWVYLLKMPKTQEELEQEKQKELPIIKDIDFS